jgi:transmembrane sensor
MSNRETSAEIEEQAALWAARLDHAPLTIEDEAALNAWLSGDSRRLGAYAMARAALARVDVARALGTGYDPDQFLALANAEPLDADDEEQDAPSRGMTRRRMLMVSASAVAAAGIGAVGLHRFLSGHRYSTATGEMLRVALDDGSIVNLNTASSIEVQFTEGQRTVLLRSGEALFDVAKDKARPFVVMAGGTNVRAVGTSFTVRREAETLVDVVVNEGIVEVTQQQNPSAPVVRLTENMQAKADTSATVSIAATEVDAETVRRQLFWREGKIGFSDASLAEAAGEFARYSNEQIVIPDSRVGEQRITGLFTATDPRGFAKAAALSLGLEVKETGNLITIVAPQNTQQVSPQGTDEFSS